MKITIETAVKAPPQRVWDAWNNPEDIKRRNAASDDWGKLVEVRMGDGREVRSRYDGGVLPSRPSATSHSPLP